MTASTGTALTGPAVPTEQDLQRTLDSYDLGQFSRGRAATCPLTKGRTNVNTLHFYGWTPNDIHALNKLVNTWDHPTKNGETPLFYSLWTVVTGRWPDPSPSAVTAWLHLHGLTLELALSKANTGPRLHALINTWNRTFAPPLAALTFRAGLTLNEAITAQHNGTLTPELLGPLAALTQHQAGPDSVSDQYCWDELTGVQQPGSCQTCGN